MKWYSIWLFVAVHKLSNRKTQGTKYHKFFFNGKIIAGLCHVNWSIMSSGLWDIYPIQKRKCQFKISFLRLHNLTIIQKDYAPVAMA
jgi:putative intracellular protease/amidase